MLFNDIEVLHVSNPNLRRIVRQNIRKEILIRDGNLSLDQVTKEDNRSNKLYLYKPEDSYAMCEVCKDCIYAYMLQDESSKIFVSQLEVEPKSR